MTRNFNTKNGISPKLDTIINFFVKPLFFTKSQKSKDNLTISGKFV